jgi:transposase
MAYSVDLGGRRIIKKKKGHSQEETSIIFQIGVTTLKRWIKLKAETGGLENKELSRSARIFKSKELKDYVEANPNALLKDVAQHFGGSVNGAFYALEREKITLKKEIYYKERDEEERAEFMEELGKIPEGTDVIYVDEAGVQKELNPIRGRAKRGIKLYPPAGRAGQETTGKRTKKDNVIAGWCNGVILALCVFAWTTDSIWFAEWFEYSLIPTLKPPACRLAGTVSSF